MEERDPAWPSVYDYDPLLAYLLDWMGRSGWSADITLLIDGAYVSGTAIRQRDFFLDLGSMFGENSPDENTARMFREAFINGANLLETGGADPTAAIEDEDRGRNGEEDERRPPRAFVHM